MSPYPIDVIRSGAVLLGHSIVCDGFHRERPVRVQTHVHDDHMHDFETSKGIQDVYMSKETHALLCCEYNADLYVRENVCPLIAHERRSLSDCHITLVPSGHMLGAVQVLVERADGMRLGYSGDFQWPMEKPIEVDALVVDSTYGSPQSTRAYTQAEAEAKFITLVHERLRHGPVHVRSHRGTVQRALQMLSGNIDAPILGTPRFCSEVEVYREHACAVGTVLELGTAEAKQAIATQRYVRLYSKGDREPLQGTDGSAIVLSAFMNRSNDPVMSYSERSYSVALSNHADFLGTIDYVRATRARYVVTDNARGGHGVELAVAIRAHLGIEAVPSTSEFSREWGL